MTAPALQVRDLTVQYGDVRALDAVSLVLEQGAICALLGVNGSGKSTLFKAAMGLVRPLAGDVRVLGTDGASARRSGAVSFVPQADAVDWDFPVRVCDVVAQGRYGRLGITRRLRDADRRAVERALERVGLTAQRGRQIGQLSGGQRKRAFLARAIAQDARLLLLDEPFAGVDAGTQAALEDLLRELRDEGRSVLISTHDLSGAPGLADTAALLQTRLVASGPPEQVLTPEVLGTVFGLPSSGPTSRSAA